MAFTFSREAYERRMAWYTQARFGMFIHWGLYAIPARGEWVRSAERIPNEAYDPLMEECNPRHCDMGAWMDAGTGCTAMCLRILSALCRCTG